MPEEEKKSLHQAALNLIKAVDGRGGGPTAKEISNATGISEAWIARFRKGDFKTPSVDKVQSIYEFLSKKKLRVTLPKCQ